MPEGAAAAGAPPPSGSPSDGPSPSAPPSDGPPSAPAGLARRLAPLYNEATDVADRSPASACALLRLLLRTLIRESGQRGRHLVRDTESLVSAGAPVGLMRALDVLALSDNEARRPGELNLANGHREVQNLVMFIHLFVEHVTGGSTEDPS
ncbi:MAG TPA: hypothetical protein DEP66_00190 [Acidimicrobiaceae bacterium]|nr:hypothetical protein [Acidimicrobiaceae bacterium]HCB36667.1 hypothetical protein [Acidimicrobiaceae bacterium]